MRLAVATREEVFRASLEGLGTRHDELEGIDQHVRNGYLLPRPRPEHFDNRAKGKQVLGLVSRLQKLGFAVQVCSAQFGVKLGEASNARNLLISR